MERTNRTCRSTSLGPIPGGDVVLARVKKWLYLLTQSVSTTRKNGAALPSAAPVASSASAAPIPVPARNGGAGGGPTASASPSPRRPSTTGGLSHPSGSSRPAAAGRPARRGRICRWLDWRLTCYERHRAPWRRSRPMGGSRSIRRLGLHALVLALVALLQSLALPLLVRGVQA